MLYHAGITAVALLVEFEGVSGAGLLAPQVIVFGIDRHASVLVDLLTPDHERLTPNSTIVRTCVV